jgi:hypothetical protein
LPVQLVGRRRLGLGEGKPPMSLRTAPSVATGRSTTVLSPNSLAIRASTSQTIDPVEAVPRVAASLFELAA